MTSRTSAVAVCCSNASRVSVISRVFSIAMTAWSAKVRTSSICRSVNGSTRWRASAMHARSARPRATAARRRTVRMPAERDRLRHRIFRIGGDVVRRGRHCRSSATRPAMLLRSSRRDHVMCAPSHRIRGGNREMSPRSRYTIALARRIDGHIGIAEPRSGLDQRVEHRLQVEGRAADDLQDVAGGGLIFERLFEIAGALLQFPIGCARW